MKALELEEAMEEFSQGNYDVLLCTSIVESGLDMPRVNTIIVEEAQMFGLASLYQLRGRVGRNDLQAFALLLYDNVNGEDAVERLRAIRECCGLGEGFKIAERDMAIRGVGNVFGEKQSGEVANVGTDLYLEMLYEQLASVESLRVPAVDWADVAVNVPVKAGVPETFLNTPADRRALLQEAEAAGREGPAALKRLKLKVDAHMAPGEKVPDPLYRLLRVYLLRWCASGAVYTSAFGLSNFVELLCVALLACLPCGESGRAATTARVERDAQLADKLSSLSKNPP